jgi:hypothetical protein
MLRNGENDGVSEDPLAESFHVDQLMGEETKR